MRLEPMNMNNTSMLLPDKSGGGVYAVGDTTVLEHLLACRNLLIKLVDSRRVPLYWATMAAAEKEVRRFHEQ